MGSERFVRFEILLNHQSLFIYLSCSRKFHSQESVLVSRFTSVLEADSQVRIYPIY